MTTSTKKAAKAARKGKGGDGEVFDWPSDIPWPPVAIPCNNQAGYKGVNSAGGTGFSVKINESSTSDRLTFGDDTLDARREMGQIWADGMTGEDSTSEMKMSYVNAFRTAVKKDRLDSKGSEKPGWWKGLTGFRALPAGDKAAKVVLQPKSPLLSQQHV